MRMVIIEIVSAIVLVAALVICEAACIEHENEKKLLDEYEKDLNKY